MKPTDSTDKLKSADVIPTSETADTANNGNSPENGAFGENEQGPDGKGTPKKKHGVLKAVLWILAAIPVLIVILLTGATLWLTPERLTGIVNEECSKFLEADVRATNVRFTLWSSFPRVSLQMDSIYVRSRTLDSVSEAERGVIPAGSDFLLSAGAMRGAINLHDLILGRIELRDVETHRVKLNLVSINDSLNNYAILPTTGSNKVPRFGANSVKLLNGGEIRFTSLSDTTEAKVVVDSVTAVRERRGNSYRVRLAGRVDAEVDSLEILRQFPVGVDGIVSLAWKPFRVRTEQTAVKLGNTEGKLTLNANLGENASIDSLRYDLGKFNLNRLLDYIPALAISMPKGVDLDMVMAASARLTTPFAFSSTELPSGIVDLDIEPGRMGYEVEGRHHEASYSRIAGQLNFDGRHPGESGVVVSPFRLSGEGMDIEAGARIDDLLSEPRVTARAEGHILLSHLGGLLPQAADYSPSGRAELATTVRFRASEAGAGRLELVEIGGLAKLSDFAISNIAPGTKASASSIEMDFGETTKELTATTIGKSLLDFSMAGRDLRVSGQGMTARLGDLSVRTRLKSEGGDSLRRLIKELPIGVDIKAGSFVAESPRDTLSGKVEDLTVHGDMKIHPERRIARSIRALIKAEGMEFRAGRSLVESGEVLVNADAERLSQARKTTNYRQPATWQQDAEGRKLSTHTPAFLQVNVPEGFRRALLEWEGRIGIRIEEGRGTAPVFPVMTVLRDLDATVTPDSIELRSLRLDALNTRVKMAGGISNIRQFLTSRTAAPINIGLDVVIDTIELNRLAAAYEHGQVVTKGPSAAILYPKEHYFTPEDTIAFLLPRNINARLRATAQESRYTNLYLYDLGADVSLKDGKVSADGVKARAAFGHLNLDYYFDTSDIEELQMGLNAALEDVDVVEFFSKFHTLSLMIPGSHDISGTLGIAAKAHFNAFPNMYLDFPSIWADVDVTGRNLSIDQPHKYERWTKLLGLTTDSMLNLPRLDARMTVHDNLMEVYPFEFDLGKYRLMLAGLNNFAGDMYYHIGVLKSPLHLPFGINLKGSFSHPVLRFGGSGWKASNSIEVEKRVNDSLQVNMLLETTYFIKEMIHKAAMADSLSKTTYTF